MKWKVFCPDETTLQGKDNILWK